MKKTAVAMLASFLLTGCGGNFAFPRYDANYVSTSHSIGDALAESLNKKLVPGDRILSTSFVRIEDMSKTSAFGQMIAEQVSSRLSQKGFLVSEVRLRDALVINESGEFMLSRKLSEIADKQDASAVLVGTYAEGSDFMLVNAKLVDVADGTVLASEDVQMPKGDNADILVNATRSVSENPADSAVRIQIDPSFGPVRTQAEATKAAKAQCGEKNSSQLVDRLFDKTGGTSTAVFRCVPAGR